MAERRIEPFDFHGKIIYIEVTEAELEQPATGEQGLPEGFEYSSAKDRIVAAGDAVRDTIAALAETVHQGISSLKPEEWTLEVNLGFKGKAGIPFVSEGEANGAVKVTAKWKP